MIEVIKDQGYNFHFLDRVDMEAIAKAVSKTFGVPRDRIAVNSWNDGRLTISSPEVRGIPIVLVESNPLINGDYVTFNAGEAFVTLVSGIPEVEVASKICQAARTRAILVAKGTQSEVLWTLVAANGSSGMVVLDSADLEEGGFTVLGSVQPISGAPELPLVDPPGGIF